MQFTIEESESRKAAGTDDIVFVPHLEDVRDGQLLADPHVPDFLKEPIRFARMTGVKFTERFTAGFKKHKKRT